MPSLTSFRRGLSYLVLAAIVAAVLIAPYMVNRYYLNLLYLIAVFLIAVTGLNVLVGFNGVVSLGHAGLMAIGAYLTAYVSTTWSLSPWLGILGGIAAATLVGAALGYIVLRAGGVYLALMTIAFGTIVHEVLIRWTSVTGGPLGISAVPTLSAFGYTFDLASTFYATALVAGLALLATRNIRRSVWGRRMLAVKSDEIATQSLGVNPLTVRVAGFTFSATLAGAAGAFYAHGNSYISPDTFGTVASIQLVLMTILGGAGYILGPLVGTGLLMWLSEALDVFADLRLALYGAILLLVLYVLPRGVMGVFGLIETTRRSRSSGGAVPGDHRDTEASGSASSRNGEAETETANGKAETETARAYGRDSAALLQLTGVSKHFGGTHALENLSLSVRGGEVHALIGPNGAGKSTVLNLISGIYAPTAGEIFIGTRAIQGHQSHEVPHFGIARTFQHTRLFPDLTVLENVMVGAEAHRSVAFWRSVLGLSERRHVREELLLKANSCLDVVGFSGRRQALGGELSYGQQKLVEIARALATDPHVLLLDEPAAGLNSAERSKLAAVLAGLRDAGMTMILVEHHMEFVAEVSDKVTVIDYGRYLADGSVQEVRSNPLVIEAYLGPEAIHGEA